MSGAVTPEEGNVSVVVRVRPPNTREEEGGHHAVVHAVDHNMLLFDPDDTPGVFSGLRGHEASKRKGKDLKFIFDRVFGEQSRQQDVFTHTTKPIIHGVLNGYNCSVFAYGATGAGKTHTMLGSAGDPGVMYLTMVDLYQRIDAIKEEKSCEVVISYLEVYNEQIQDLLEPKGSLAIREDPQKGVVVQGLSFHQPKSAEQLLQMLANGNLNRTQHPTDANASSSRSHAVFQIYVKQQERTASISQDVRVAKMSLIDLAGSERASSTNAKGERLREGANINRSLLALINVINALADAKNKKTHIPYRDSKLTRLLKDSLGGNCRTVMIAAISPSSLSYDDTYNTLKYANRAKEIKLSLKSNVINLDCHISKYAAVCEELKAEVAQLKAKLLSYESKESTMEQMDWCESPEQRSPPRLAKSLDASSPEQTCEPHLESLKWLPSERLMQESVEKEDSLSLSCGEEPSLNILPAPQNYSTNRLVLALLRIVRKQYAILKLANLHTPEMEAEVQAVEVLAVRPETSPVESASDQGEKSEIGDANTTKSLKGEDCGGQLPLMEGIIVSDVQEAEPIVQAPPTKKRQPIKRCRKELLPDLSPSLRSPMVPAKRRRPANTPCKPEEGLAATPEVQVKRPRRSAIPSRPILRPAANLFPPKTSEHLSHPSKRFSLCNPKKVSKVLPNLTSQTVTKSRVPLGTSALQNAALLAPAARDMNATFDLSEEGWLVAEMDKTVTFASSDYPGWENGALPQIDCTFVKSCEIPVFTTCSLSDRISNTAVDGMKAPPTWRRRTMSLSSSRLGSGNAGQTRIGRLQLSTAKKLKRPPTIAENPVTRSSGGQSTKNPGRGTPAPGRSCGGAPLTRIMQVTAARS